MMEMLFDESADSVTRASRLPTHSGTERASRYPRIRHVLLICPQRVSRVDASSAEEDISSRALDAWWGRFATLLPSPGCELHTDHEEDWRGAYMSLPPGCYETSLHA